MFYFFNERDTRMQSETSANIQLAGEADPSRDTGLSKVMNAPHEQKPLQPRPDEAFHLAARGEIDLAAGSEAMNAKAGVQIKAKLPWLLVLHLLPRLVEWLRSLRNRD